MICRGAEGTEILRDLRCFRDFHANFPHNQERIVGWKNSTGNYGEVQPSFQGDAADDPSSPGIGNSEHPSVNPFPSFLMDSSSQGNISPLRPTIGRGNNSM